MTEPPVPPVPPSMPFFGPLDRPVNQKDFPEPTRLGFPPPPLPVPAAPAVDFHLPEVEAFINDPVADIRLDLATPIRTRMSSRPPTGWVAANKVLLTARSRTYDRDTWGRPLPEGGGYGSEVMVMPDGTAVLIEEQEFTFEAQRVRRYSLESLSFPVPWSSRLRGPLGTTTGRHPGQPTYQGSDWVPIAGTQGVLDRFGPTRNGPLTGFRVTAMLDDEEAVLVTGSSPVGRAGTLVALGRPLALSMAVPDIKDSGFEWHRPPGFAQVEVLNFSSEHLTAFAQLEQLDVSADSWRASVFQQGPFLRGAVPLGARDIRLSGFGSVALERFDWQPSGRGRLVTSIAHGVGRGWAFWFALQVDLGADVFATDPDALLASVTVDLD